MLLLHYQFYKPLLLTYWVLPLIISILLWWSYHKLVASIEGRLQSVWKTYKINLFPTLPNYTSAFFRFSIWSHLILLVPTLFIIGNVVMKKPINGNELADKLDKVAKLSNTAPLKTENNQEWKVEIDYSDNAITLAMIGLKRYRLTNRDRELLAIVPETWSAEFSFAELQKTGWKNIKEDGSYLIAEVCSQWVAEQASSRLFSLKNIACYNFMVCHGIMILYFIFCGFIAALFGYYIERRVLSKLISSFTKNTTAALFKEPVTVQSPFWHFGYTYIGSHCRQWSYSLKNSKGERRIAIIPHEAVAISKTGFLIDTWPSLPRPSVPVIWGLSFLSGITMVGSVLFNFFLIPLFTKNLYLPAEAKANERNQKKQ